MIFFRADANSTVGVGHVMRCISIARAILSLGEKVLFITADDGPDSLLDKNRIEHISLSSDYTDMESETDAFDKLINEYKPECIIVDSYRVTDKYLSHLSDLSNVVYLDDMCEHAFPADIVINYNIQADEVSYRNLYANKNKMPIFLIGLSYVPLREEFANAPYSGTVAENVTDILFTAGGADPLNIAEAIAKKWMDSRISNNICLHIVCGPFYKNVDELAAITENEPSISLHRNVTDMIALMSSCQMAVASTGSTIYELCSRGIPTISFWYIENQRPVAEAFEKKTPVKSVGDYGADKEAALNRIMELCAGLTADIDCRKKMSAEMRRLTDGRGAEKIAKKIIDYIRK